METITSLTARQLRRAADIKERIEALEKELSQLLGGLASAPAQAPAAAAAPARRKLSKISAAGIARIRAAQRLRWAAVRKAIAAGKPGPKRRKLSAAGRARLVALARARWAKVKASGGKAL
jgi:hypothetical protein